MCQHLSDSSSQWWRTIGRSAEQWVCRWKMNFQSAPPVMQAWISQNNQSFSCSVWKHHSSVIRFTLLRRTQCERAFNRTEFSIYSTIFINLVKKLFCLTVVSPLHVLIAFTFAYFCLFWGVLDQGSPTFFTPRTGYGLETILRTGVGGG